ncbi:hypothetical protein [Bifidobacterium sp.]|uniref:hypothetical protein n=1 Tax=Bifidobacterium sp. TaxID=41200 RepID=UPI0025C46D17|nr:hypothetical protein [Bifidobacterium sp.]
MTGCVNTTCLTPSSSCRTPWGSPGTIKAILEGCSRFDEFEVDSATFLAQVGDKINCVKNNLIAQGIEYVRLPEDEWYTMRDLELPARSSTSTPQ